MREECKKSENWARGGQEVEKEARKTWVLFEASIKDETESIQEILLDVYVKSQIE